MATRTASLFGAFERKQFPVQPRLILAASFVFYNAASLVNLNVNTVRVVWLPHDYLMPGLRRCGAALGTALPVTARASGRRGERTRTRAC